MIKVASYCRVSTDKEDQANSFSSQQRYFREYISRNPDWQLHEIYADEGITGTSTKKRTQFNRMMHDAHQGLFKLVLTKEVSRFSRNILDTIACTRALKALGVGVVFMSDGFSSLDPDAELRLSIIGSIAQEESRKTSSRVKWGQTRQMERGVVFGTSMLGYNLTKGVLTVEPEGAEIVRQIFYKYGMEKKGTTVIARELQEAGFRTYTGNPNWSESHILKILKNEKYAGDLVQKKSITPDYLTHAKQSNHGEEELIVHRDHHEPIISRPLWDTVQNEIHKRNRNNASATGHSTRYIFSGKIYCAECGAMFVSRVKTRKDGSSYRRWGCITAAREGAKKVGGRGCDVGKLIRHELATEMLQSILQALPMDKTAILRNVSIAVSSALKEDTSTGTLERRMKILKAKKEKAVDAYLSGHLSREELTLMKQRYEKELTILQSQLPNTSAAACADLYGRAEEILSGRIPSDAFLKSILEYMCIHKDGRVEVKLNQLPTLWLFRLHSP